MKTKEFHRYVFDLIVQGNRESFDSLVSRLVDQAMKCDFPDEDENIKRAIIAKCRLDSLRKHAFKYSLSLEELIVLGRELEIEAANGKNDPTKPEEGRNRNFQHKFCTRCGANEHMYFSRNCPARNLLCMVCNREGHLDKFCFRVRGPPQSGARKRSSDGSNELPPAKRQAVQFAQQLRQEQVKPEPKNVNPQRITMQNEADSTENSLSEPEYFEVFYEETW